MIVEKLFDKVFLLNFLSYSEFNKNLTVTLFLCEQQYAEKLLLCCRVDFGTKFDRVKVARQRQWSTAPNDQRIPARILRHLYISDNLLLHATIYKSSLLFYHDHYNCSFRDICGISLIMTILKNIKIMIIIMIIMFMIILPMTMIKPDDHVVSVKGPGRETVDGQSRPHLALTHSLRF